jgi:hypothetical protein
MSRRELLDLARLALLRFRVRIARPLPLVLMTLLRALDRRAAERPVDKPWRREASARVDRILADRERE